MFRFWTFAKGVGGIIGGGIFFASGIILTDTGIGAIIGIPLIGLGVLESGLGLANIVASFGDKELPSSPITLVTGSQKAGDIVDFSAGLASGRALASVTCPAVQRLSQASSAVDAVQATRSITESATEIDEALRRHRRPSEPDLFIPIVGP